MTSTTTESANSNNDGAQQKPTTPAIEKPQDNTQTTVDGDGQDVTTDQTGSPKKEVAPPKPTIHKLEWEKDVVYLYQFSRSPTIPSASPFCLKVENWLRMAEVKYENVDHKMKYKSKKGQLPFVELNGEEIADSAIIIRDLSKYFGKDLDEGLTLDQKNVSHAFESMLNNHTSWVVRWWRYNNPGEFIDAAQLDIKRTLNSRLPNALLNVIFKFGFRKNVKQAVGHGLGRHSEDEIYDFGKSDLTALSEYLADKEYFFGKQPHLLDCVAFAHLTQFIYVPFAGMKEWMEKETPNLIGLVDRIKEKYWSDWDEMVKTLELNTHLPKPTKEEEEAKKEEELKKEEEKKKELEKKKEEELKKKEEKKKLQEEKKKEREEKKKKEREEKEKKKKEEEERKKAEKEKKEKEKAEKEAADKEKAEAEAKAKEEADKKKAEEAEKAKVEEEEKKKSEETTAATETTKDTKPEAESEEKKD